MIRLAIALCGVAAATAVLATAVEAPAEAQDAEVSLVLVDQAFAIAPGGRWTAAFDLVGPVADLEPFTTTTTTTTTVPSADPAAPTTAAPRQASTIPSGEVRVIARRPISSRAEMAAVLDGRRVPTVDAFAVPLVGALTVTGDTTRLSLDIPTSIADTDDALTLSLSGLYPLTVQVVVDGLVVATHLTFAERLPAQPGGGAGMQVAVVATTPDPGPEPTDEQLTEGRRQIGAIAATAAAVDGPISVAIPPVLLDGLTEADPALDAELRTSLSGDEVIAMTEDVLDPSSAVAIGEQEAFTRELLEGEDALDRALGVTSTRETAWLATSEISTGAATMLRGLGFRSLVFSPEVYNALEGSIGGYVDTTLRVNVELGGGDVVPAMVIDPNAALLDPATLDREGLSTADAAVHLAAGLVTTRRELGDDLRRGAVLLPPPGVVPDPDVASRLATYVGTLPDLSMAPLSVLSGNTDIMVVGNDGPHVVTLPDTAGPDLSGRAERIDLTRISAVSSGSMLPDDDQLEEWSSDLDTLLSTGLDDAQVDAELARITAEATAVREQVELPQPDTFTLTGRSSTLRLNLRSTATVPLQVMVSPSSAKLRFPDGPELVELAPDGVTEVVLDVEARSNGTSSLEVAVLTPTFDQPVGPPIVLTAHVNTLTGLGQVVTGGALVVLGSWWFGHFRRRRRARLALINEVDAPGVPDIGAVSPDAAEAVVVRPTDDAPADSLADP